MTTVASTWAICKPRSASVGDDGAQQQHRVGVAVLLVGVGEVLADVAHRGGAEQRVDDRMGQHVGVGVAVEAELVRDGDPAEDERAPGHEPVRVPADARDAGHPIGSRRRSRRAKTASSLTPSSPRSSSAWS